MQDALQFLGTKNFQSSPHPSQFWFSHRNIEFTIRLGYSIALISQLKLLYTCTAVHSMFYYTMGPKRRSQAAPDELPNSSQRTSGRKTKPSGRKKAAQKDADKPAERPAERPTIGPIPTKKDISQDTRVSNTLGVVANGDFTRARTNSAGAKKAKEEHSRRQTLKAKVAERWHAKQAKQQIE